MRKMSTGVAALFVAGLLGLACSDQSGLNSGGGIGGGAKGGQIGGGTTGGSGGAIGSGGATGTGGCPLLMCPAIACPGGTQPSPQPCGCPVCGPNPDGGVAKGLGGATGTGGTTPTGGTPRTGGTGGTGGCPPVACPAIACLYGYQPNPDPCGCPGCAPPSDGVVVRGSGGAIGAGGAIGTGGSTGTGGKDGGVCLALPCAMPICPGGYVPSPDPCSCPICATDGGTVTDGGKKDAAPICPPINCPMLACTGGYLPSPDPCGCPTCAPPDAGVAKDAGRPDTRPICPPIACPAIACLGGYVPNPDPCGCPLCGPTPDAGVAKDATPPTACPMLASLNSTDAAQVGYSAKRTLLQCTGGGVTETCVSNDATGCPGSGSAVGDSAVCSNLCAANQYGLSYGGVPFAPPPSIALPAGCGQGLYTPAGVAFYCCPCGT